MKGKKFVDPMKVLLFPHFAEKSSNLIDLENKIVFMVNRNASKSQIKNAVERLFNVKVEKVNVQITPKGEKKAYVKLSPENNAIDLASKLGRV